MNRWMQEWFRSFRMHASTQVLSLVVLTLSFTIIFSSVIVAKNFTTVFSGWGENSQISAYLAANISESEKQSLQKAFQEKTEFSKIEYWSGERAFVDFKKELEPIAPEIVNDKDFENPFPASFVLTIKSSIDSPQDLVKLKVLAEEIKSQKGVNDVTYGQGWMKSFSTGLDILRATGMVLFITLLAGVSFVIVNLLRTSLSQRREEIEILELLGSPPGMIRSPYYREVIALSFLSASTAIALTSLLVFGVKTSLGSEISLFKIASRIQLLTYWDGLFMLFTAMAFSVFIAWLILRKLNDGWSARRGVEI